MCLLSCLRRKQADARQSLPQQTPATRNESTAEVQRQPNTRTVDSAFLPTQPPSTVLDATATAATANYSPTPSPPKPEIDQDPSLTESYGDDQREESPLLTAMNQQMIHPAPNHGQTSVPFRARAVAQPQPKSPLLFDAISEGNFELAEALIEENRGLQFVSLVQSKNTVLHAAVLQNAPTNIIDMLLSKGADPNIPNSNGRTPVYLAARHDVRLETMKLLIEKGGNINKRDEYQYTPLMAASYNGASIPLVGLLLSLGAEMSLKDQNNRIAADWAREGNHEDIETFLTNISIMPVLCSAWIPRLGSNSPLRGLTKDLMRLVRDALCVPNTKRTVVGVRPTDH